MRVVEVVGARPQFVKLAPVSRALGQRGHEELILHTGQHFDDAMSRVFFEELGIPSPHVDLGVHSLSHGTMTGRMLEGIEAVLASRRPDAVVVYGDTDSTLAGALAASKLSLPCAHVEAGLRSFDRAMPEETNRVVADHVADLLLAPTETAMANLAAEGLASRSRLVGDVMHDAVLLFSARAGEASAVVPGLEPGGYFLATLHRASATADAGALGELVGALDEVASTVAPVVLPLHPRTRAALARFGVETGRVLVVEPVSYLGMMALLRSCRAVLTDSGGLQKEAYSAGRLCFTLREQTEWVELVGCGANVVCGTSRPGIVSRVAGLDRLLPAARFGLPFYGKGDAAGKVVGAVEEMASGRPGPERLAGPGVLDPRRAPAGAREP